MSSREKNALMQFTLIFRFFLIAINDVNDDEGDDDDAGWLFFFFVTCLLLTRRDYFDCTISRVHFNYKTVI